MKPDYDQSMAERETAIWEAAHALMVAVVASPTRISSDVKVCAAIDAMLLTRARLQTKRLDGYTPVTMCDKLIAFWQQQKAFAEAAVNPAGGAPGSDPT